MFKTFKVMLHPNNKQRSRLFQCAGVARWAYNWALGREKENHDAGGKFLTAFDLSKELTVLKRQPEYAWLNDTSRAIAATAIKDAVTAYQNFFAKRADFPKFKAKGKSSPSFYLEGRSLCVQPQHIWVEKLTPSTSRAKKKFNWVKLARQNYIPTDAKIITARVTFDGLNWWVSAGVELPDSQERPSGPPIGVDVGVKDLAVCSDGTIFPSINHTPEVRRLEKKLRRLQRRLSCKFEMNKDGQRFVKTKNIVKLQAQILRVRRRLDNLRQNQRHQATASIIKRLPQRIVVEDLNVKGMLKNRHLAKAIQDQGLAELLRQLSYKSDWHNIEFQKADPFFPSSQLCSCCGAKNPAVKNLALREWTCPACGAHHHRDINAAVNLANYGQQSA